MPKTVLLQYPATLTDKAWQKKKGVLGKTKKTGVGESLVAIEKLFAKTQYVDADTAKALEGKSDPAQYVRSRDKLPPAVLDADVRKLTPLLKDAEKKIFLARNTFASDKSVAAYLTQMGQDLAKFQADLTSKATLAALATALDAQLKANVAANPICQMTQMAPDLLGKRVTQVIGEIRQLRSQSATVRDVEDKWSDGNSGGRGLATAVNQWDTFAGHLPPKNRLTLPPQVTARAIYANSSLATFGALPWISDVGDMKAATKMKSSVSSGTDEGVVVKQMLDEYENSIKQLAPLLDHFKKLAAEMKKWM